MRVNLTHEQADFDALAALLGASLLRENDLPVLPRRMNRNTRSFINLYGADLPFIDPRDLSSQTIEAVLLVDTQSLVTLKGTRADIEVRVIDHHTARTELPATWDFHYEPVGAITTLFVEDIQENAISPTPIQATLLLLGIYEDTGSLTYSSTTPRDVRAAAYLLEQGANLTIAAKFLNPPLSSDQRKVYDRLLANAETHLIHGQKIVVSCAQAEDMNEEVSSVAHKIRDLLEPDALFIFVTTGEGIRLVARSTTNRINVSDVAGVFGGGGHERAAAALIRIDDDVPDEEKPRNKTEMLGHICQRLAEILPDFVQPSIRVGQMMSRRPRLISPGMPAQEAAQLMQRYGYEGYPVVQGGKVIGLLTRRAVDRAVSHRLNLTAASLMEAGEVTVQPAHSIEHLQQVMSSSGWGQVPVVDPENGSIVGIVTRTDLLKTLALQSSNLPTRQNLSEKLEQALPPSRLALLKAVASSAHAQHAAVYIVGGFVRDLLLERPSMDFDMVVEGDAIALANTLAQRFGGQVISHSRFGTAKWTISGIREELARQLNDGYHVLPGELPESLDLISSRTEFYERPTALPTVERGNIKLDLHRRDFTINTLALRLDGLHYGDLYDYWGGLNDLRRGLVRVLHSLSFIDDPTRLLRAVRFEQRFGFRIEERTLQLIAEARPMLKQVSGDRIRHEFDLILVESHAQDMLARLNDLDILTAIHPDLPTSFDVERISEPPGAWGIPPKLGGIPTLRLITYLIYLAPLNPDQANSLASRLKFSGLMRESLDAFSRLRRDLPGLVGLRPSQIAARLDSVPLTVLWALHQTAASEDQCRLLEDYTLRWRSLQPYITGDTLREIGIPPGPAYRSILKEMRDGWLDGIITNREQEQETLNKLVAK